MLLMGATARRKVGTWFERVLATVRDFSAFRRRHAGNCGRPRALREWGRRIAKSAMAASLCCVPIQGPALAGGVDVGAGLGLMNHEHGFEGGWDVQVGYEFKETERFSLGVQWQWFKGWTSESSLGDVEGMAFRSNALYLTARPRHEAFRWLQLKAGVVNANYKIAEYDSAAGTVVVRSDRSGETGLALGWVWCCRTRSGSTCWTISAIHSPARASMPSAFR
jgi:hypothetical protein